MIIPTIERIQRPPIRKPLTGYRAGDMAERSREAKRLAQKKAFTNAAMRDVLSMSMLSTNWPNP